MGRPVSRERRETEVYLDLRDHLAARVMVALLEAPVPSVPPALLVSPVLKVQRELKVLQVLLVPRETQAPSVPLVLLVPQVR